MKLARIPKTDIKYSILIHQVHLHSHRDKNRKHPSFFSLALLQHLKLFKAPSFRTQCPALRTTYTTTEVTCGFRGQKQEAQGCRAAAARSSGQQLCSGFTGSPGLRVPTSHATLPVFSLLLHPSGCHLLRHLRLAESPALLPPVNTLLLPPC